MTQTPDPAWLPHDPDRSASQVRDVLEFVSPPPKRVLDLGCGDGRVLVPLARMHHTVVGVDCDARAIERCCTQLRQVSGEAELVQAPFDEWLREYRGPASFDAILCLGNTFMTIFDLDAAIEFLSHARELLAPGGTLLLDDLPHDLWPELTEGNWMTGISEDGALQLIWHPDDSVFTIRRGNDVDPECWQFKPNDVLYRLWTTSALEMASRLAGLSPPVRLTGGCASLLALQSLT